MKEKMKILNKLNNLNNIYLLNINNFKAKFNKFHNIKIKKKNN